jgi:methylphosphotriester-DNA--protein-cysteine methyltransferase
LGVLGVYKKKGIKSEAFHKITCEHVTTIKEENLIYFQRMEEALASGRRGCKTCKPDE